MGDASRESVGVADVYAGALLDCAPDAEQQRRIAAELADLTAYVGRDAAFGDFLRSRLIDMRERAAVLERLFRGRMHDLLLSFLHVLNRRARTDLLGSINRCVQLRMAAQRDQQEVVVETAVPLWHELRTAIERVMGMAIGKTPILIEELRPEHIGGVVIRVGDVRIDGSVRSRLRGLRERLGLRAGQELRSAERYVEGSAP